jgi:hypothetical protein
LVTTLVSASQPRPLAHRSDVQPRYGRAYLRSAWWRQLREAYAAHPDAPHCCAVCATPRYEHHHRSYERLGAEPVSDLIALCHPHHQALHRAHRRAGGDLETFSDAWIAVARRRYATAPLPDVSLYREAATTSTASAAIRHTSTSSISDPIAR